MEVQYYTGIEEKVYTGNRDYLGFARAAIYQLYTGDYRPVHNIYMRTMRVVLYAAYMALPVVLSFPYIKIGLPKTPLVLELFFSILISILLVNASGRSETPTRRLLMVFPPALIIFSFQVLELISYYLQGNPFNDAFYFHMSISTLATGVRAYTWLIIFFGGTSLVVMTADLFLVQREDASWRKRPLAQAFVGVCLALVLLPNAPKHFFTGYHEYRAPRNSAQRDIEALKAELIKNHVNIEAFSQYEMAAQLPQNPKNLVLLYLESLESAYLDELRFPGLVPNIKKAIKNSLFFSNLHQYTGTGWTISGVVASQCGIPLVNGGGNDSIYQNVGLKQITCLGDILRSAGYYQVYMGGASLAFAGKGAFYKTHGYDEVLGYEKFIGTLSDPDYINGWGVYDDTLFDLAADSFAELARKNTPFNLTLLTLDTHQPNGNASRTCPPYSYSDNSMLNAVHCTDFLFGRLIDALQKNPEFRETVVFVTADHLAMRNVAEHLYPKGRNFFAFAMNVPLRNEVRQPGSHFDIPHTIIDLLDIDTNAQFAFGQSLLQQGDSRRFSLFISRNEGLLSAYLAGIQRNVGINICEGNGIYIESQSRNTINIGGQSLVMSEEGIPRLPVKRIFLLKSTREGIIEEFKLVTEETAEQIIAASPDSLYFLLARNAAFPFGFSSEDYSAVWQWWLGNPSSFAALSGATPDLRDFKIEKDQCSEIVEKSKRRFPFVFSVRKYL